MKKTKIGERERARNNTTKHKRKKTYYDKTAALQGKARTSLYYIGFLVRPSDHTL